MRLHFYFQICTVLLTCLTHGLASEADDLVREALAAESRLDSRKALELFLAAEKIRADDPFILRKIARQYSDQMVDLASDAERQASALRALEYSQRAVALEPKNAENILSVAICHGKLAHYGGTREKVQYSRLVRDDAERALALDPSYAWAHHLLGRWHREVSEVGPTARIFLKMFYGGLPAASTAEAVRQLERAVALEPTQLQHRLELGFAYAADHQPGKARASFEAGLAMTSREKHDEPAKARARRALGELSR